jgi:hypothetical protein
VEGWGGVGLVWGGKRRRCRRGNAGVWNPSTVQYSVTATPAWPTLPPPQPPPCSSHSRLASEAGGSAYPWARLRLPLSPLNWATAAARMDLRVEVAEQLT